MNLHEGGTAAATGYPIAIFHDISLPVFLRPSPLPCLVWHSVGSDASFLLRGTFLASSESGTHNLSNARSIPLHLNWPHSNPSRLIDRGKGLVLTEKCSKRDFFYLCQPELARRGGSPSSDRNRTLSIRFGQTVDQPHTKKGERERER